MMLQSLGIIQRTLILLSFKQYEKLWFLYKTEG